MAGVILVVRPTSDNLLYVYVLRNKALRSLCVSAPKLDQELLPLIDKLLKQAKIKPDSLLAIGLVQSPMSLASQRLAVSVVNSLGWAWSLKVFSHHGEVTITSLSKSSKKAKKGFLAAEYSAKPRIGNNK